MKSSSEESRMMLPLRHSSSSRLSQSHLQEDPSSSAAAGPSLALAPASNNSIINNVINELQQQNDDPAEKNKGSSIHSSSSLQTLFVSTIGWLGFGIFGWYFPRYLIYKETTIATKKPPYQLTASGDVIIDFELNQKWVHPATVDSTYNLLIAFLFSFTSGHLIIILSLSLSLSLFRSVT